MNFSFANIYNFNKNKLLFLYTSQCTNDKYGFRISNTTYTQIYLALIRKYLISEFASRVFDLDIKERFRIIFRIDCEKTVY
jgi:hypothetical protein